VSDTFVPVFFYENYFIAWRCRWISLNEPLKFVRILQRREKGNSTTFFGDLASLDNVCLVDRVMIEFPKLL
jgi:hypothetical protein